MANRPQDYVTPNGRMTTNTVEGFHGLALMYRGKQIDLEHTHYTCKTNMAICHKVYNVHVQYTNLHADLVHLIFASHRTLVLCGKCCVACKWVCQCHSRHYKTSLRSRVCGNKTGSNDQEKTIFTTGKLRE